MTETKNTFEVKKILSQYIDVYNNKYGELPIQHQMLVDVAEKVLKSLESKLDSGVYLNEAERLIDQLYQGLQEQPASDRRQSSIKAIFEVLDSSCQGDYSRLGQTQHICSAIAEKIEENKIDTACCQPEIMKLLDMVQGEIAEHHKSN